MPTPSFRTEYQAVKRKCAEDSKGQATGQSILKLSLTSLRFLVENCKEIDLVSRVQGKEYFSFKKDNVIARPVNRSLFLTDSVTVARLWKNWEGESISSIEFSRLTYTIALAPCLAMEIADRQNKKGPATFFECYIGHLFAKAVNVNPTKQVRLPVGNSSVRMTMDFLIDMGEKHRKVHLPVKMSSRERVVQAWAHQRLLDAAYGGNTYRGIMVLFSETKLDSRSLEVVEICVPDQWLAYQSLLAHMDRIYYFDVPCRYKALTERYPAVISIKPFGEFFSEKAAVLQA